MCDETRVSNHIPELRKLAWNGEKGVAGTIKIHTSLIRLEENVYGFGDSQGTYHCDTLDHILVVYCPS